MGKEWLNWVGNGKSRLMRKRSEDKEAEAEAPAGCMCAVFQMFNVHYFPFALQPQPNQSFQPSTNVVLFQDEPPQIHVLKGVEAPRNSLDLMEPFMEATSSSSTQILEEYLNMQVGIQIKTTCETRSQKSEDFSSSICSNSPSTKTPNLVARLMGLDLLPQTTSPSLSSSIFHATSHISPTSSKRISKHDCSGTLSLPETPRISSCSRRSDVENHRLSLQLQKENFLVEELELSGFITHVRCDKDKSKGQILKQVRESVRRRFGLDLTNTIKPKEQRKDINILVENDQIQPKKPSSFSENKPFGKIKVEEVHELQQEKKKSLVLETSKRVRKPPQASDDAVRSKKEEPFIHSMVTNKGNIALDKKAKKTPLSSDLVNISFPANQQLDKQESSQTFHDSPTKKRSKQFSSHQYLYHQQQVTPTFLNFQEKTQDSKQNHYIQTILKHMGIEKNKLYSSTSYPPVLPLDLSLFHFLEVFDHNTPEPRYQRKLVFDLVDELLVEIFNPISKEHDQKIKGSDLVEILCKKVGSFPLANCQVIEDIDALIYEDFSRCNKMGKWDAHAFQGERECMVMDIEDYIVDLLVHETAAMVALMDVDMVTHCVRWLY